MILIIFLKKLNMINNSQKNINNYYIKKQVMMNNDEKAKIYDNLIYHYQKLQEEIRQIKAKNFEVSERDQQTINELENKMRYVYNQAQRLF